LDKDGEIRISSRDSVVRSELAKYPVKNIPVEDQDAPTRYEEVRKLAAQGKTPTLHGELPGYISTGLSSCTPTYSFNWSDLTGAAAGLGRSLNDQRKVQGQIRSPRLNTARGNLTCAFRLKRCGTWRSRSGQSTRLVIIVRMRCSDSRASWPGCPGLCLAAPG
jgi:hypothetical protein